MLELFNGKGLVVLEEMIHRFIDTLLRTRGKGRLIMELDSTEDRVRRNQESVA